MSQEKKHPLQERYTEREKVAYLSLLSSIIYVDQNFSEQEKNHLEDYFKLFNISDEDKRKIYAAVFNLNQEHKLEYLKIIQNLKDSELKYTLISDLCLFALADSNFDESEYLYIVDIGKNLGVTKEQIQAIRELQENLKKLPSESRCTKELIKECSSKLAAVGVPIGAVAISGSVFGLSAAGITSGLAALGALVGGGMLAGTVLVVPAIAVGSAYAVKKFFDIIWGD